MLSLVTLTFDNFEELERTLASTRGLDVPVEHVVVNGGACPRTAAWLAEHVENHVSEPDEGIADAFNKGLERAKGRYVLFLNSGDVLIDRAYLEEAWRALEADAGLDFVYADVEVHHYSGRMVTVRSGDALPRMPFCHPTLICRKAVFDAVGGFDTSLKLAMDLDFAFRLVRGDFRGRHFHRTVARMDGGGVSATRHFLGYREKVRLVFRYRHFTPSALLYLAVYGVRIPLGLAARRIVPAAWWKRLRRSTLP